MEVVLVGAPGSGARTVGRALAERHQARFIDLTGDPERRADAVSGLRVDRCPDAGPGSGRSSPPIASSPTRRSARACTAAGT